MSNDFVNGLFEFISALFLTLNVRRLYKDKEVKGVSIITSTFFFLWGIWNLYFYPKNHLQYSFIGGLFIVLVNSIWVGMMIYYTYCKKAIYKYNNGKGALLCSKCRTIIKTNVDLTPEQIEDLMKGRIKAQYCDKCK